MELSSIVATSIIAQTLRLDYLFKSGYNTIGLSPLAIIGKAAFAVKTFHIKNPTIQFALPIVFETVFSTLLGLVVSSLVGGISGSSLTVISQGNMVINLIVASLSMLTTGASVLCARLLGAGEYREASGVVEQALLLSAVISAAITIGCFLFAAPSWRC